MGLRRARQRCPSKNIRRNQVRHPLSARWPSSESKEGLPGLARVRRQACTARICALEPFRSPRPSSSSPGRSPREYLTSIHPSTQSSAPRTEKERRCGGFISLDCRSGFAVEPRGKPPLWQRAGFRHDLEEGESVSASRVCFATAVLLVLLVGSFSGYIRSVRAETSETPVSSALNPDAPVEGGVLLDSSMDNTSVRDIATFERWDGKVLPENSLNSSVGDWPYLVTSKGTTFAVRRLNDSFEQGIPENAVYDFLPTGIKETLVFPVVPSGNVISILFTATYKTNVSGTNVTLLDAAGSPVWRTEPFHAWDSSETPVSWDSPVVSVSSADGQLVLSLDEKVLSAATYPLYIDPTWTLSSTLGWGSSTFQDATEDKGDHNIKIGMFADNFNDNTNEGQWVVESGTLTFATGVMQLGTSTTVKLNLAGSNLWTDYRFGYKIRFTQSGGTAQAYFRYTDANNHYYLDMSEVGDTLTLKKKFAGILYTVATMPGTQ